VSYCHTYMRCSSECLPKNIQHCEYNSRTLIALLKYHTYHIATQECTHVHCTINGCYFLCTKGLLCSSGPLCGVTGLNTNSGTSKRLELVKTRRFLTPIQYLVSVIQNPYNLNVKCSPCKIFLSLFFRFNAPPKKP